MPKSIARGGHIMKGFKILALTLAAFFAASAGAVQNTARQSTPTRTAPSAVSLADVPDRQIYGYWYMTGHDRDLYRQRLREAKNTHEEALFLAEHYERMQARAKAAGATLPDPPPLAGRDSASAGRR
jgi:hypothetical protein